MGRSPLRVIHIIDHLGLGGAQTFLLELARYQRRGEEVQPTVCCLTEKTELSSHFEEQNIPVIHLDVRRDNYFQVLGILWRLPRVLRQGRYDLVHTHLFVSGFFGRVSALICGIPTVVHEQRNESSILTPGVRAIDYLLSKGTHAVICVSRSTRDFNLRFKGVRSDKLWIIPNAINLRRFSPTKTGAGAELVTAEFSSFSLSHVVIGIGRLEPEKRFDVFLQAAAVVLEELPDVGFLLVGDGTERPKLQSMAEALGIAQNVRFLGSRSDIPALLSGSDVFMLASDFEGLPLTLLEALAMEVPAVVSRVDGSVEVLDGGRGGVLVDPEAPGQMAAEVLRYLKDDDLRRQTGLSGRANVQERYTIEAIGKKVSEVYRSVLGLASPAADAIVFPDRMA